MHVRGTQSVANLVTTAPWSRCVLLRPLAVRLAASQPHQFHFDSPLPTFLHIHIRHVEKKLRMPLHVEQQKHNNNKQVKIEK